MRGHDRRLILDIYIDSADGVTLEQCASIARALNAASATDQFLGSVYTLDVSSPGVDRPLAYDWQYKKHIGRTMRIVCNDGTTVIGRLDFTDTDSITLRPKQSPGKKKPDQQETVTIPFSAIATATVEISFS